MPDFGLDLPAGFSLVSYVERPDLVNAADTFNGSVWPEFMLQDAEAGRTIELDALVTSVREIGARVGVTTPSIDALLGLTRLAARSRALYPLS